MSQSGSLPSRWVYGLAISCFAAGWILWVLAEQGREEAVSPRRPRPPFKTQWRAEELFSAPSPIQLPFPKAIVTEVIAGDTFLLSTGTRVKLAGVLLEGEPSPWAGRARELSRRIVERREVFIEYESGPENGAEPREAYLYVRIPVISGQAALGPEYVAWSLNAELLKLGYAQVDASRPFKHHAKFEAYEGQAREEHKGKWQTTG